MSNNGGQPMIQRRSVLKGAAVTVLAAGAGPIALFSGGPVHAAGEDYTREQFEALLNRGFYVGDDAHPTLELVEVLAGPEAAGVDQFTLVFRGAPGTSLDDEIHRLRPEGESSMDLHLADGGSDADGSYFTAAFALMSFSGGRGCAGTTNG